MKNSFTFYLTLLLFLAVGCYSEKQDDQELAEPEVMTGELTIQATLQGDPDTKTTRDPSNGDVLWVPGDAISLFYGSGTDGGSRFVSNATEPSKVTNFTGTITAITGGADVSLEDTYFWGVYPYSDDISCDGTTITMTIPPEQKAVAGTFDTGLFPSIGRSQGLIMGFYNVCGGWRFSVTKEGVRKVTLRSNGGEALTGRVKVGLNASGIPVIREILDGSDEVVLECPAGEYFEVGQNYYMTILPGVLSSGLTMTLETYTEKGEYNRTASTTINRSRFAGITNIDNYLTTPYALKTGNIPVEDANFKAYLVANFDQDSDGEISYAEAVAITNISVWNIRVSSLQGIEYCNNLRELNCNGQIINNIHYGVSSLDLSNNRQLEYISCINDNLTSLDLTNNLELNWVLCGNNELSSLLLPNSDNLRQLSCNDNLLTILDVSPYTYLNCLAVANNQLTNLDISNNLQLDELTCFSNQLSSLEVSQHTRLKILQCGGNPLSTIDVSNNTALTMLQCDDCSLGTLDVTNNTSLNYLMCGGNQLTTLDVSHNTALIHLSCNANQLTSLDVTANTSLIELYCTHNHLTTLNVSLNTALKRLHCLSNQLASLDVSNNTALIQLYCYNNQLASLNVTQNTALTTLDCSPMSTMETLFVFEGQEIPNVTVNRNSNYIPDGVQVVVPSTNGGNEGTGDDPL